MPANTQSSPIKGLIYCGEKWWRCTRCGTQVEAHCPCCEPPQCQCQTTKNAAAVALGSIKSERKAKTSAENGKRGGRPRKIVDPECSICRRPVIEGEPHDHPCE